MKVQPIRRDMSEVVLSDFGPNSRPMADIGGLAREAIRRLRILQQQAACSGNADMALSAECCAAMIEGCSR